MIVEGYLNRVGIWIFFFAVTCIEIKALSSPTNPLGLAKQRIYRLLLPKFNYEHKSVYVRSLYSVPRSLSLWRAHRKEDKERPLYDTDYIYPDNKEFSIRFRTYIWRWMRERTRTESCHYICIFDNALAPSIPRKTINLQILTRIKNTTIIRYRYLFVKLYNSRNISDKRRLIIL